MYESVQSLGGVYAQCNLRLGPENTRTIETYQNLLTAKLALYICTKLMRNDAPALRTEQIDYITQLLRGESR